MLATLLTLALLTPGAPPELTYAAPSKRAKPALYKLTTWNKGDRLYVSTDLVNVRKKAEAKAEVVTQLDFGTEVTLRSRGPRVKVGKSVNHWYEVEAKTPRGTRRGFVWGAALSPFLVEGDLDGDGVKEQFSVSWTGSFAARVRVFEPLAFGKREAKQRFVGHGNWKGGRVTKLAIVPKEKAGVGLLELEVLIDDPDDPYKTYWRTFFTYHPPEDRGVGPGKLIEVVTVYRNNDAKTKVTFDKRARKVVGRFVKDDGKPGKLAAEGVIKKPPPPAKYECALSQEAMREGTPPKSKMTEDGLHVIFEKSMPKGVGARSRHGGCEHYGQTWTFEGVAPKPTLRGRTQQAAKLLRAYGGDSSIAMADSLEDALKTLSDSDKELSCRDEIGCAVKVDGAGDRQVLRVEFSLQM